MEESNLTSSSVSNEAPTTHHHVSNPITKKKRNQPGHPEANAEVIALSPKTLVATKRFICEICNKGFQREQNLQLHRRGHNLPWNLKNKNKKKSDGVITRKKVYVCPETKCVHHNPARALGDLTGIKKHFSRKHCEKIWKCDLCSKKYAVQSDFKAHSKICGTKQYTCHCGTLFSRRDSFITHRAFCDALGVKQDCARNTTVNNPVLQSPNNYNSIPQSQTQIQIHSKFSCISNKFQFPIKEEHQIINFTSHSEIPPWLSPIGPFPYGPPVPPVDYPSPNPTSTVPTVLLPPTPSQAGELTGPHHDRRPDLPSRDDELRLDKAGAVTGGGTVTGGEICREQSCSSAFGVQGFEGQSFEESWRLQAAIDEFSGRNYSGDGITTRDFLGLGETDLFSFDVDFMNNHA